MIENYVPYTRSVQYYETDQMKIVHHSNYIRWFEEARIDYLDQIGLPYDNLEKMGVIMPILACQCEYKQSMKFGDEFQIYVSLEEFNGVRILLSYEVFRKSDQVLAATGTTKLCFLDDKMKPVRLKKEFPVVHQLFENLLK